MEGRMAAHSNGDVSPVVVPDVKKVMVHIGPRFLARDIGDLAFRGPTHLPDWPRSATHHNQKQTSLDLMLRHVLFGGKMLLFAAIAIDDRYAVRACPGP